MPNAAQKPSSIMSAIKAGFNAGAQKAKATVQDSPFKEGMSFLKVGTDQKGSWLKLLPNGKVAESDDFTRDETPIQDSSWKINPEGSLEFVVVGYVHTVDTHRTQGAFTGIVRHEQNDYGYVRLYLLA